MSCHENSIDIVAGAIEFLPSLWNEQIVKFAKRNQLAKIAISLLDLPII